MEKYLRDHAEEAIYYNTDHHWTSLGAYYGYVAVMEAMGMEIRPLGEKVTVSNDFYGTLYSTSGIHWLNPDQIDTYIPAGDVYVTANTGEGFIAGGLYVPEKLEGKDKYTYFLGGNQPLAVVKTGHEGEKLLLVRDSYADSEVPYLLGSFSEIHLIDLRYYKQDIAGYVRENGIDRVAISYSLKNFMTDTNVTFLGLSMSK